MGYKNIAVRPQQQGKQKTFFKGGGGEKGREIAMEIQPKTGARLM